MKEVADFGIETYELLQALADKIKANLSLEHGLLGGQAGQLLFLYNLAKSHPEMLESEWLSEKINDFINSANTVSPDASMGYGLAGVAWFYQYILKDQDLDDSENINVDKFFSQVLIAEPWESEFEFVLGLSGYTPYLMRRRHTTLGKENLLALVNKFSSLAEYVEDGLCYWKTSSRSIFRVQKSDLSQIEINMGLAHGHVSVLAALVAMCEEPSIENQAKELLKAGCDWLISKKQDAYHSGSYFPYVLGSSVQSRLGWCYGDLTIALTIIRAAKILNREDYSEFALEVALHSATRDFSYSGVQDAGLCHGSSGIALIFYLLYKDLDHSMLREAAFNWQAKLLSSYKESGWRELYKHNHENDVLDKSTDAKLEDYSLLEGYAGIGLCLLALRGEEVSWADSLLLG